jgi:4-amino-4-deoxychorismate lyase
MPAESPVCGGGDKDFELIETFRFEPERGFVRLDRHLARMAASAEALGFVFRAWDVERELAALKVGRAPLRVRLSLNVSGKITISSDRFIAPGDDAVWSLRIAKTRLSSRDPLLRHKTSRREAYESARAEFARAEADEVLLLNENGEVCEGSVTSLFVKTPSGRLLTPALDCGLLAGVLRGEMLENGSAVEAKLFLPDLLKAASVFVGNSLRGLIPARLI